MNLDLKINRDFQSTIQDFHCQELLARRRNQGHVHSQSQKQPVILLGTVYLYIIMDN